MGIGLGSAFTRYGRPTPGSQIEDVAPAPLISIAKNVGLDVKDLPADTVKAALGKPYDPPFERTYRNLLVPVAKDLKYLATPGPVEVRVDKQGRQVYLAKGGGETYDPRKAQSGILKKAEQRPLDYLQIGRGGALGAGKAAAKVKPALGVPGRLELEARTGEKFTTASHANPVRRAEQEAIRRATTGATRAVEQKIGRELPVVGEHARAVRLGAKQTRRAERTRIARELAPFEKALKGLKPAEQVAVVLRARGKSPSEMTAFVRSQLAEATARLTVNRGKNPAAADAALRDVQAHQRMLKVLAKTSDELFASVPTVPKLAALSAEARRITDIGGDVLEGVGKLSKESRADRPYLTARVVGGARFEPKTLEGAVPYFTLGKRVKTAGGRARTITRPRTEAEAASRLIALDSQIAKFTDKYAESLTQPGALAAEQARLNRARGRYRKRVRAAHPEPTAKQALRAVAEEKMLEIVARNPEHPTLKRFSEMLAERDSLRARLNAVGEASIEGRVSDVTFGSTVETIPGRPPFRGIVIGVDPAKGTARVRPYAKGQSDWTIALNQLTGSGRVQGKGAFVGGHIARRTQVSSTIPTLAPTSVPPGVPQSHRAGAEGAGTHQAEQGGQAARVPVASSPAAWRDGYVKSVGYAHALSAASSPPDQHAEPDGR